MRGCYMFTERRYISSMPDTIWETTEDDLKTARIGIELTHNALSPEEFIETQIEFVASMHAQIRFLRKIIQEATEEGRFK